MKNLIIRCKPWAAAGALSLMLTAAASPAATNIDPAATGSARWGWAENAGWVNLVGNGTDGVVMGPDFLSGKAWLENAGWLSFGEGVPEGPNSHYTNTAATINDPPNYGVNNDRLGNLYGYAWGENIGWVNFGPNAADSYVNVSPATGKFSGQAWSENLGWISFGTVPASDVATAPTSAVPVSVSRFSTE